MAATEELIKLAARIAFQQLATPYRAALERRIAGVIVCGVLAFIAGAAGAAAGVAAFWFWLAPMLGPAAAALVCMVAFLLIALILGLAAAHFARRSSTVALTDMFDSKEIGTAVAKHAPELVIAAAIGGLILGLRRRK